MYSTFVFITAAVLFFGLTFLLLFTKGGRSFFKDSDGIFECIPEIIDGEKSEWEEENKWLLAMTLSFASLIVILIIALISLLLGLVFPITLIAMIMWVVFYKKIK